MLVHRNKGADSKLDPILSQIEQKLYKCDICDYVSTTHSRLKKHRRCHTNTNRYSCEKCDFSCSKIALFREHQQQHKIQKQEKPTAFNLPNTDQNQHLAISGPQIDTSVPQMGQKIILNNDPNQIFAFCNEQGILEPCNTQNIVFTTSHFETAALSMGPNEQSDGLTLNSSQWDINSQWTENLAIGDSSGFIFDQLNQNFVVTVVKEDNGAVLGDVSIQDFELGKDGLSSMEQLTAPNQSLQEDTTHEILHLPPQQQYQVTCAESEPKQSQVVCLQPGAVQSTFQTEEQKLLGSTLAGETQKVPRNHSKAKMYHCEECSFSCDFKSTFKKHMETHSTLKNFKCAHCNYSCNDMSRMKSHLLKHTNEKILQCELCEFTCKRQNSLVKHMKSHGPDGTKLYQCSICQHQCKSQIGFQSHMDKHEGHQRFKCDICALTFPSAYKLKKHKISHGAQSYIQCQFCPYWCLQQQQMTIHLMQHSVEFPFSCHLCGAKYKKADSLQVHILNHHEQKHRFKCHLCNYAGNRAADFREHLMTHSGLKPYQCKLCSYTCIRASQLNKHMKVHMKDSTNLSKKKAIHHLKTKTYRCAFCDFTCTRATRLKAHVCKVHLDLPENVILTIDMSHIQRADDMEPKMLHVYSGLS
ncbi:zinc finger protein 57 [Elysia marginata]|uniref:Zinc finger protein 57 n=1 Tax=Elysia marginata TaxID=1093978 RepID=A0AAV4IGM2_9GAST|nr:zinc finger protein 57 [Elysia marginata]